jgi:GAF domain-containing protein
MSKKTVSPADSSELIKIHQANYAVFQAQTEEEINRAIQNALQICHYVTAYYSVNDSGLERIFTNRPSTKRGIRSAPEQLEMTPAEIVRYFAQEVSIAPLAEAKLPEALKTVLSELECEQVAILPILQDVVVRGVLLVGAQTGQPITSETIDPLIHLTDVIPIALDGVKAARAIKQRLRELEAISETSQTISSSNDLVSLYRMLHKQIIATIGEVSFAVALYNGQNETIEIPYAVEEGSIMSHDPFPLGEGAVSILIRTRQPLMLVEDTEHRLAAMGAKVIGKPAKSWMGCPLVVGGDAIGALIVQDLDHEQRFTQDDLRLMIALSAQVAGAIYNIRLLEESRRSALQLQTVAEISKEVSSSLIVDNLLRQAISLINERFNFYHAGVFLVDITGEYAVIREATGEAGAQMKRAGHKLGVGSKSIVGYVTQQKEALIVKDVTKDPNYYANPLLPETRAEACLPLKVGDRILGVLDVQSKRPYAFTDENIKILQILADQLAVAVVNSELFAEAQERLSQHRLLHHVTTAAASSTTIEEALNSAVQGLQVILGGDQIAIMMADREQKMLDVKSAIGYPNEESSRLKVPFGVGITGWVAAHRQPQRSGDVTKDSRYISLNPKVRSELVVPLIYRNEVLGVLNVESSRLNAYSENDEEMLGTLAGSLAAIIAHSRLLEQFRQQIERERLLYEITNKIRRTTNPDKILAITADELSKTLNTRRTQIAISLQNLRSTNFEPKKLKK